MRERVGFGSNVYRDGLSVGAEFYDVEIITEYYNSGDRFIFSGHAFYPGFLDPIRYLIGGAVRRFHRLYSHGTVAVRQSFVE